MKKTFKLSALALALAASAHVSAQESSSQSYDKWLGVYGMYYGTDVDKPARDFMDDGAGVGLELGWRFDESWAVRGEFTLLEVDYQQILDTRTDVSGMMFGVDAMYFMPNDWWYIFGGLKQQDLDESYTLVDIGLGKHWDLTDNVKLSTEVAAYRDIDESYYDYSVKVGLSIPFGNSTVSDYNEPTPVVDGDSDNDGVMNSVDQCPNTSAGTQVDSTGCAMAAAVTESDSDSDGVVDTQDMCPDTPMNDKVDADGCTVFDEKEVTHNLRVLFASESAEVEEPHSADIEDFVAFFKRYGKTEAVIEGHASAPGTDSYNMDLSKRRAEAFKDVLVNEYGIDRARLSTEGFGESELLMEGTSPEANRVNRRISIRVTAVVEVPEKR